MCELCRQWVWGRSRGPSAAVNHLLQSMATWKENVSFPIDRVVDPGNLKSFMNWILVL